MSMRERGTKILRELEALERNHPGMDVALRAQVAGMLREVMAMLADSAPQAVRRPDGHLTFATTRWVS